MHISTQDANLSMYNKTESSDIIAYSNTDTSHKTWNQQAAWLSGC